jgi:predicted nucleic acid-binding protein
MSANLYLLDTSVACAIWDKGHARFSQLRPKFESLGDSLVVISPVTVAEVEYGLQVSPNLDESRKREIRHAISQFHVLPINQHTVHPYAEIRARLFSTFAPRDHRGRVRRKTVEDLIDMTTGKHLGITENDLWIVSNAVQHDAHFVTGDGASGMIRIVDAAGYQSSTSFW